MGVAKAAIVKEKHHDRKLFGLPKEMCKPALAAAHTVVSDVEKCVEKKLGKASAVFKKFQGQIHKAEDLVIGKMMGMAGCPTKRRMWGWSSITHAVHAVANTAAHAVKGAACAAAKANADSGCGT